MVICRTPFRISFFGGGTDYPAWYRQHGGAVISATIDKYCYLTCRYLPPFFEHRIRVVYSKIENCQTIAEIRHPAVREVLQYLNFTRGVEIHHDGDLPARSGMGSSSAFTAGLLNALHALQGQMISKHMLAMESIRVEQELLKETVGCQDQVAVAYGGFNHIRFPKDSEIAVTPVNISLERSRMLQSHLLLFFTGIKRTASDVAGTYVNDLDRGRQHLRILGKLVDEGLAVLQGQGEIAALGDLLHEAWMAKRDMSSAISNPQIDEIYLTARRAGAAGGKLLGAGGGGFLLLFANPAHHPAIREALAELIHVPFNFEYSGSRIVYYDQEEDYAAEAEIRPTSDSITPALTHQGLQQSTLPAGSAQVPSV